MTEKRPKMLKKKPATSYEKALDDIDNGRLYEYDSLEDLIKDIG